MGVRVHLRPAIFEKSADRREALACILRAMLAHRCGRGGERLPNAVRVRVEDEDREHVAENCSAQEKRKASQHEQAPRA